MVMTSTESKTNKNKVLKSFVPIAIIERMKQNIRKSAKKEKEKLHMEIILNHISERIF